MPDSVAVRRRSWSASSASVPSGSRTATTWRASRASTDGSKRLGDQSGLDVGALFDLYGRRQLIDRPDDHPGVLVGDNAGGLRCGGFRKQRPETFAADGSARAEVDRRANPASGFVR